MSLIITHYCVNCGLCESECPNNAICFSKNKYEINIELCTKCVGYFNKPNCQFVCPINKAIIKI